MIDSLSELLDDFPGAANQTRCFAHTLSLSAKSILKQFDAPKTNTRDDAAEALADLYEGLDIDERDEREERQLNDDEEEDKIVNPWDDFRGVMTDEQRKELDESVQPVRSTLVKVA